MGVKDDTGRGSMCTYDGGKSIELLRGLHVRAKVEKLLLSSTQRRKDTAFVFRLEDDMLQDIARNVSFESKYRNGIVETESTFFCFTQLFKVD